MIASFVVHLFVYVAVNGFLVAVWLLGDGSLAQLQDFVTDPDTLTAENFWPIWPMLGWGTGLVIHLGATLGIGVFGRRSRRRRRQRRAAHLEHAGAMVSDQGADLPEAARQAVEGVAGALRPRPRGPERRWVTVMFTDIVDSTGLNEALGDDQWARLLRGHRELVRQAFVARGGHEVNTQGDGFMARFANPAEAVLCAVDIQQSLAERRGDDTVVPRLRIGIHAGEAVEDDGDLVGRVVNLAARVAAEAEPDEILVTEPVADYLGSRLELADRGIRELKGIAQPRHLLSVLWEDHERGAADATIPSPAVTD